MNQPLVVGKMSNKAKARDNAMLAGTVHTTQTYHNIDCGSGSFCNIRRVFHLNCLTAQLSYEGRAAVEVRYF
jgi:hypothetical protein